MFFPASVKNFFRRSLGKKITANQVFTANKIGHVAWLGFDTGDHAEKKEELLSAIEKLGFPVFIKPSNAGSSVGITVNSRIGEKPGEHAD